MGLGPRSWVTGQGDRGRGQREKNGARARRAGYSHFLPEPTAIECSQHVEKLYRKGSHEAITKSYFRQKDMCAMTINKMPIK